MHTVEKSAEILVKMLSMRPDKRQTISPQNFRDLAKDFKVTLPKSFYMTNNVHITYLAYQKHEACFDIP